MNYLTDYMACLRRILAATAVDCARDIQGARRMLAIARAAESRIFICGNGGSAATASHFALDLTKNAGGFRAIALPGDMAVLTAFANDIGYGEAFAMHVRALGSAGDLLVAISASGDSPNILAAIEAADRQSMWCVGLLGFGGGKARGLCDISVTVPCNDYALVEDVHMAICHMLATSFKEGPCES